MKILAFAEVHGDERGLETLKRIVGTESPDLVVFSGDIVHGRARHEEWSRAQREGREPKWTEVVKDEAEREAPFYERFFSEMDALETPVLCVPGMRDAPKDTFSEAALKAEERYENVHVIHNSEFRMNGFSVRGIGGEVTEDLKEDRFIHRYRRRDLRNHIEGSGENLILLTHTPPVGERVSKEGPVERGSPVMNDIMEKANPVLILCGRIDGPEIEHIKGSCVVSPGPFKEGCYTIVNMDEEGNVDVEHREG